MHSILRFHALYAFISISIGLSFKRHQQTGHFPSKSDSGALSLKALESLTQSARSAHLHIPLEQRQNTLLLRKFQSGRAILKSLRISYTQSRQWTSTHYVTLLKTDHFSSKSRMCALSSIVLESHGLRHLLITPKHSKTLHSSAKSEWSALKSTLLESLARRPSHPQRMIPSTQPLKAKKCTPLLRKIKLECALLKTP